MRTETFSSTPEIRIIQEAGAEEPETEKPTTESSIDSTTTQEIQTTTETDVKPSTVCPQDVLCMALDVSWSMTVCLLTNINCWLIR